MAKSVEELESENSRLNSEVKELRDGMGAVRSSAEAVDALKSQVESLAKANADLSSKLAAITQDATFNGVKTKYPDVPEDVLKAIPADKLDAAAGALQEKFSKLKGSKPKTDPLDAWAAAGGISPTLDAETEAQRSERMTKKQEAMKSGDPMAVLRHKANEVASHLRKMVKA